jgi:tagatose 1,6-diphosphate aldolase GatY/KbaY
VLTRFRKLLDERRTAHAAAGAFTCYDVTTALGVVRAAEERSVPVILLVSEASFSGPDARLLVPALLAVAKQATVPACVQLDHVSDPASIEAAFAAGVGAVLADGSRLPPDENAALAMRRRGGGARRGRGGRTRGRRGRRGRRGAPVPVDRKTLAQTAD